MQRKLLIHFGETSLSMPEFYYGNSCKSALSLEIKSQH
jgi:hypothetical protein